MEGLGERLPPKVLDHCKHLTQDMLPLLFLGTLFCVMVWNINGIQTPVIRIYITNDFEANSTSLLSNGLMLSFSLSRPASSMVGFWQLLFCNIFPPTYFFHATAPTMPLRSLYRWTPTESL